MINPCVCGQFEGDKLGVIVRGKIHRVQCLNCGRAGNETSSKKRAIDSWDKSVITGKFFYGPWDKE